MAEKNNETLKNYPKRKSAGTEQEDGAIDDKLKILKDTILKDIKNILDERLTELANHLFQRVDELEKIVLNNEKLTALNSSKIEKIEKNCSKLKKENDDLKKKLDDQTKKLEENEEKIEDQVNRSMRKTLIFTNIIEGRDEGWDPTDILAETIAKVSKGKIDKDAAAKSMERVHRGKAKRNANGRSRPIYAAIDDWRVSEKIKELFADRKNTSGIYCQQMYGPRTTWRRNQALALRKKLKEDGELCQGYVAYPARLMTKKRKDDKYTLYKDFSNIPVVFDK